MIFYSVLDWLKDFAPTASGSAYAPIYERVDDPDGLWHLEKTGERNIQKQINSARPPAPADILKHALRGDFSMMSNQSGVYTTGDEVTDLGEAFLLAQKARVVADQYSAALAASNESEVNVNVNNESAGV